MDHRIREDFKYIQSLIVQGEHQHLDFKQTISDSRKIARSLVAFANTEGGTLLVGVKDNGNISGIRSDEEIYMLDAAVKLYCRPNVPVVLRLWEPIKNKHVLEVEVSADRSKIWRAIDDDDNWKIWIRHHDKNILVDKVWEKVWYRRQNRDQKTIIFSGHQLSVLENLSGQRSYSLIELVQIIALPVRETEELLTDFVMMGLLVMQVTENGIVYTLAK